MFLRIILPLLLLLSAQELDRIRQLLEEQKSPEAEAAARELLVGIETSEDPDPETEAEVLDLLVQSLLAQGKNRTPETLDLAERALLAKENLVGPEHPDLVPLIGLHKFVFQYDVHVES